MYYFVFFKAQATTEIYTYRHTLSRHDALPIFPLAVATFSPTGKSSAPTGGSPRARRSMSSMRLRKPSTTHLPPVSTILRCRRGLVGRKLVGAKTSRNGRAAVSTMSSWYLLTPPIPGVAACHHCWFRKQAWQIRLKGGSFKSESGNRRDGRQG